MSLLFIIVLIIFVVKVLPSIISDYNSLVRNRNSCINNWSKINIVLKRRADLIPNLVSTVKGYASHEKNTLEEVVKARSTYISASSINDQVHASNEMNGILSKLMMLSENYPELKADTSFLELQKELRETEDLVANARIEYNNSVNNYQNVKEVFPSNIVAYFFEFKDIEFYNIDNESIINPNVTI